MKILKATIFILLFIPSLIAQNLEIGGFVFDNSTKEKISYAHIGILSKNIGTTSDKNGFFKLNNSNITKGDTLVFHYIGYREVFIPISAIDSLLSLNIFLEEATIDLPISIVEAKSFGNLEKIGFSKTKKQKQVTGWGRLLDVENITGIGERGTLIQADGEFLIKNICFFIAINGFDSLLFRLHIYDYTDGEIGEEITSQNFYAKTSIKKGLVKIPLGDTPLIVNGDFVISIEWIKAWGKPKKWGLYLTASNKGGKLFGKEYRHINEWIIKEGWHAGIYAEVKPALFKK